MVTSNRRYATWAILHNLEQVTGNEQEAELFAIVHQAILQLEALGNVKRAVVRVPTRRDAVGLEV